jgi:hypothetical protein
MPFGLKLDLPWGHLGCIPMLKNAFVFSSEITVPRALMFGMFHWLFDLYKRYLVMPPWNKKTPLGSQYRG